jgi:hypothetical protein
MKLSHGTRNWSVACAAAGCVALLGSAGCTGGDGSPSAHGGHTAAPTPSTTTARPAATATPSTATSSPVTSDGTGRPAGSTGHGIATCTTGQLRVTTGQRTGAMGSVQVQLVFTNRGERACVTAGYPGVSFVTGDQGRQVGSAASRQGGGYQSVTLAPGGTAHAAFRYPQVGNLPGGTCRPTTVRGLRVYPPDQTAAVFVPLAVRACSTHGVGVGEIAAMRSGTGTER